MALFYTTVDGTLKGRASYGYRGEENARKCCEAQNLKAESLGIKARYEVAECENREIGEKVIRD